MSHGRSPTEGDRPRESGLTFQASPKSPGAHRAACANPVGAITSLTSTTTGTIRSIAPALNEPAAARSCAGRIPEPAGRMSERNSLFAGRVIGGTGNGERGGLIGQLLFHLPFCVPPRRIISQCVGISIKRIEPPDEMSRDFMAFLKSASLTFVSTLKMRSGAI